MKSLTFLPLFLAVSSATIQDLTYSTSVKSIPTTTANAGRIAAADAAAASSIAALASVASLFAAVPSAASSANQFAAASLAQSAQIASIASMFAASPSGQVASPLATAPLGTGAGVIPPASRVPAIPAAPKATVVTGKGTNASGDSCACQCACGAMPVAQGSRAGVGAFGGMVGQLPAVGAMAKGSA